MVWLVLASAVFLITHIGLSSTALRGRVAGRIGEKPFLGLYSLLALLTLGWMISAYDAAPFQPLWSLPGLRHLPLLIMPLSLILLIAGVSTPNPTSVGMEDSVGREDAARGILRITRHPVQWAILLWAVAHILANGDLASLIFFGAFGLLSALGPWLIDRKMAAGQGAAWRDFARRTSGIPFLAILQGRNRLRLGEIGWGRLLGGLALFAVLLALHPWLFGVRPY